MNIYVDSKMKDDARRAEIYQGSIFAHSPSPNALKLCQLAQGMIEEAFLVPFWIAVLIESGKDSAKSPWFGECPISYFRSSPPPGPTNCHSRQGDAGHFHG